MHGADPERDPGAGDLPGIPLLVCIQERERSGGSSVMAPGCRLPAFCLGRCSGIPPGAICCRHGEDPAGVAVLDPVHGADPERDPGAGDLPGIRPGVACAIRFFLFGTISLNAYYARLYLYTIALKVIIFAHFRCF